MFKTIFSIAIAVACAIGLTRWIDQSTESRQELKPLLHAGSLHKEEKIPHHKPMISHSESNIPNHRSLDSMYVLRAYLGAPPIIPHPPMAENAQTFKDCLTCHSKGGWVQKLNAWAPVTPHPEYKHCQQCHVYKNTDKAFVAHDWASTQKPKLGRSALGGSPLFIPHSLQLRENCASCHVGPSAPAEIRTGHPERVHCRQCHLPAPQTTWKREAKQ